MRGTSAVGSIHNHNMSSLFTNNHRAAFFANPNFMFLPGRYINALTHSIRLFGGMRVLRERNCHIATENNVCSETLVDVRGIMVVSEKYIS